MTLVLSLFGCTKRVRTSTSNAYVYVSRIDLSQSDQVLITNDTWRQFLDRTGERDYEARERLGFGPGAIAKPVLSEALGKLTPSANFESLDTQMSDLRSQLIAMKLPTRDAFFTAVAKIDASTQKEVEELSKGSSAIKGTLAATLTGQQLIDWQIAAETGIQVVRREAQRRREIARATTAWLTPLAEAPPGPQVRALVAIVGREPSRPCVVSEIAVLSLGLASGTNLSFSLSAKNATQLCSEAGCLIAFEGQSSSAEAKLEKIEAVGIDIVINGEYVSVGPYDADFIAINRQTGSAAAR